MMVIEDEHVQHVVEGEVELLPSPSEERRNGVEIISSSTITTTTTTTTENLSSVDKKTVSDVSNSSGSDVNPGSALPLQQQEQQQKEDFQNTHCTDTPIKQACWSVMTSSLPEDLLCRITSYLDVRSLMQLRRCNRFFRKLASRNEAGWQLLCEQLWKNKVSICKEARILAQKASSSSLPVPSSVSIDPASTAKTTPQNALALDGTGEEYKLAFQISIEDSINREYMTREELCYDYVDDDDQDNNESESNHTIRGGGGGTVWSFRFKESAGSDWTSVDPWYHGLPCRKMVFLKNGTIKYYIANSEPTWNGRQQNDENHHAATDNSAGDADADADLDSNTSQMGLETQQRNTTTTPTIADPPMVMTWRFLTRPMDLPTRPIGSYVRITVGGRDVPTYSVRRSPTGNWGFFMESCWGLYASFDLPPRYIRNNPHTNNNVAAANHQNINNTTTNNGGNNINEHEQRVRRRRRLRRTPDEGLVWVDVSDNDDDDDNDDGGDDQNDRMDQDPDNGNGNDQNNGNNSRRVQQQRRNPQYRAIIQIINNNRHNTNRSNPSILMDDSSLSITNEVQWREAFLYNVGARILPEGDDATDEFDRAFRI